MEKDLTIISNRLQEEILDGRPPNPEDIREDIQNQASDGSWSDIDYDDTSPTHWIPREHLRRLLEIARAYRTESGAFDASVEARKAFLSGLRYWIDRDPQSENWFRQSIGSPATLGDAVLMMGEDVPSDLVDAAGQLVLRSGFTRTGANLIWESSNVLTWACVTKDEALLREAVKHISAEVQITTDEGIQPDDSFHQHGPQNYTLGYGRSYALNVTGIAVLLAGTTFAFPEEKIRTLSRLVLDGQQWFVYGRQIDYHAMGREAFRGGPGRHNFNANGLTRLSRNMRSADPARAAEYDAFASRITGDTPPGSSGPMGNKHFWRSDTMVHRAGDWYASVRFHSTRTYAAEVRVNRENLQGYHLSDGVVFLMQRGDEYHDLQPLWDYRKLPGLTVLDTDEPLPYGRQVPRSGTTTFVGGATDGLNGSATMDYERDGIRARKAYFFTDDGIVCLGSGIHSERPERLITTLNQCRLKSEVTVLRGGKTEVMNSDQIEAGDIEAVLHDGIAYVLLEDAPAVIRAGEQSGSWQRVEAKASDESLREDVFTFYIDHGARPSAGSYAYRLVPGASESNLKDLTRERSVRILSNTSNLQAVHYPAEAFTQVIFHSPGELALPEGGQLRTDGACAIQFRLSGNNRFLTISDPTQELEQLVITLDGHLNGPGATLLADANTTRVVIPLPQGPNAGQSVVVSLTRTGS